MWDVNGVIWKDEIKLSGRVEAIIPVERNYTALIRHVRSVGPWRWDPEGHWCICVWNEAGDWCGLHPACWSKTSSLERIQPLFHLFLLRPVQWFKSAIFDIVYNSILQYFSNVLRQWRHKQDILNPESFLCLFVPSCYPWTYNHSLLLMVSIRSITIA